MVNSFLAPLPPEADRLCDRLEGCGEEKRSHSLEMLNCYASKNGGGWGEEFFARFFLGGN